MSEWQPIETAPRDGTRILLAPYMMTAHWEFGDENWQFYTVPLNSDMTIAYDWQERASMFFCVSDDIYGVAPTYWMPILPPPTEDKP